VVQLEKGEIVESSGLRDEAIDDSGRAAMIRDVIKGNVYSFDSEVTRPSVSRAGQGRW
jgi:hypothetical protein